MPFDSQGTFTRVHNWEQDRLNDIEIVSDRHDEEDDNFAGGFNLCLCRDGRAVATGNLKMGNFKITGLANGETTNDAINKGQLTTAQTTLQGNIDALAGQFQVVSELPVSPDADTFYFVTVE